MLACDEQEALIERLLQVHDSPYGRVWTTQGYGIPREELVNASHQVSWLANRVEGAFEKVL